MPQPGNIMMLDKMHHDACREASECPVVMEVDGGGYSKEESDCGIH